LAELGLAERDDAADEGLILILAVPLLPPQQKEEIRRRKRSRSRSRMEDGRFSTAPSLPIKAVIWSFLTLTHSPL
jgi:hypothetical protein